MSGSGPGSLSLSVCLCLLWVTLLLPWLFLFHQHSLVLSLSLTLSYVSLSFFFHVFSPALSLSLSLLLRLSNMNPGWNQTLCLVLFFKRNFPDVNGMYNIYYCRQPNEWHSISRLHQMCWRERKRPSQITANTEADEQRKLNQLHPTDSETHPQTFPAPSSISRSSHFC